jgi:outer membrane protein assembly factor BamB/orotate phosphoribosyltransferase
LIDLKKEILKNCIKYKSEYLPINADGVRCSFLFDFKGFALRKEILQEISDIFWKRYKYKWPFQLGCIETSGISILSAIIMNCPYNWDVNGFIIRKERKSKGMGNLIEGDILHDVPIVLIDDIFNSGKTVNRAMTILNIKEVDIFVILDFKHNKPKEIKVNSIFSLHDFGNDIIENMTPDEIDYINMKNKKVPSSFVPVWERNIEGGGIFHVIPKSTPLISDGIIYRGSDSGIFSAFDMNTAVNIWNHKASGGTKRKGILSSPAEYDGKIYYGAYNGQIYALDKKTGAEIWKHHYCDWIGSSPCIVPEKKLLLIGFEFAGKTQKGSLNGLDLDSGELIWSIPTKNLQHGSAAYSNNLIAWGTSDNKLVATSTEGNILWEYEGGEAIKYKPSIYKDMISFGGFDKYIYILDFDGNLLFKQKTDNIIYSTPLFTKDKLWCGSADGHMYVIDTENKKLIRKLDFNRKIYSSPVLIGEEVMFGANDGNIYLINENTLELTDNFCVKDGVTNPIVISEDQKKFYVSTMMNDLYCFTRNK